MTLAIAPIGVALRDDTFPQDRAVSRPVFEVEAEVEPVVDLRDGVETDLCITYEYAFQVPALNKRSARNAAARARARSAYASIRK